MRQSKNIFTFPVLIAVLSSTPSHGMIELENGSQLQSNSTANGPIKVGIRPEHLSLDPAGTIAMQKGVTEQLGSSTLVHGTLDNSQSGISVALPGVHHEDQLADTMMLAAAPGNLHVFSTDGKRLD